MECGDVLGFYTTQTDGADGRYKYHLCVCVSPAAFLFINTSGNRVGSLTMSQEDWLQMPKAESFVSCNILLQGYKYNQLRRARHCGRVTDVFLRNLIDHLDDSEVMPQCDIDTVIDAIMTYLE